MSKNQKLTFEVNAKDVNIDKVRDKIKGIDSDIEKLQKKARDIRISDKGNTDIGKEIVDSIQKAISKLEEARKEYSSIIEGIVNQKLDSKEFDNFVTEIDSKISFLTQRITDVEQALDKIPQSIDTLNKLPLKSFETRISNIEQTLGKLVSATGTAMESLKNFDNMISTSVSKPKEVEIKVDTSQLEKVERILNKIDSDNVLDGKSELKINTASASKQLYGVYSEYQKLQKELNDAKDPKQISTIQMKMDELLPTMSELVNRIIQINKLDINGLEDGTIGKLSFGRIDDFSALFNFLEGEIDNARDRLGKMKADMKSAVNEVTEEATTQVSSFTFKNGGLRIPVTIDAKSKTALEKKYNEITSLLQEYADNHPVNVTMRLFPLNTNRANAEEITNELRRIQTDINSVEDEGLKTKLNSLYGDLEEQFKKALNLKIKVDLGETEQSVRVHIKNLQDAIKQEGFTIYPEFKVSEDQAKVLGKTIKEIQKKSTIDLNKQFSDTARDINKLINSGDVEKWSTRFSGGLQEAYTKLENLQPFLEALANFFVNTKLSKNALISDTDVKNIVNLSNAIKGLKDSIEKIESLDLTKIDTSDFSTKIQNSISDSNPIIIPIEPDLSGINSFIDKIENAISSTGINVKISDTILPKNSTKNSLRDILQDNNNANHLYLDIRKKLGDVAGNIGEPIQKKIAESLVSGLRNGLSDTSQILREGFKGTQFESIVDQIIGDEESLNTIKQVANEAATAFIKVSNGISQEGQDAKTATVYKEEFANANKKVAESAIETAETTEKAASGINQEANAIKTSIQDTIVSNETPVSTESSNSETRTLLSKKEAVEQLRSELQLTKKAAEDLFSEQGYTKTKGKYQIEQQAVEELITSLKEKKQVEESSVVNNEVTKESAKSTDKEAKAMSELYDNAIKAAEAKKEFVGANEQVLSSIIESLKGLNSEGEGFKNLNKIINNLANNKEDRITDMIANLELLRDTLTKPVDGDSFINALRDLANQGDSLKDLAVVIRASKKQIDKTKTDIDNSIEKKELTLNNKELALNEKELALKKDEIGKFGNNIPNGNVNQRNVIGTSTGIRIDRNGNVTRLNQSFTTQEEVGRKITYTQRPDGSYEIKGITNYKDAIKEATKALLEQRKAEYDLSLEQEKTEPNVNKVQALSDVIQDCTRRIDAATDAAQRFDSEFANFINDSSYGSKFNFSDHFLNKVQTESAGSFAKLEKDYFDKISKRNTSAKKNANKYAYDIQFELDNGNHTEEFNNQLRETLVLLNTFKNIDLDIITEQDIEVLNEAIGKVRELNKEGKLSANKQANENSVAKGLDRINKILSTNTKMSFRNTQVYNDLKVLQQEFKHFNTSRPQAELDELNTRLNKTIANFDELGESVKGKNIFQTIGEHMRSTTAQLIAQYLSFQDLIRYIRTMISTLVDLDTQLIDLRKTTTMSASELNNFYHSSSDVAKQLGVTTSEIISQAAAWSRLGYSSNEAATLMAQLSSQFASISPGASTEDATNYLVSTMQAFGVAAEDVERSIMDNVNAIGNTMATSNAEIGEMLERSSAAMKAANNSIEETIALESAAVQITRNAEMTGTAFRTKNCPYVQKCA